MSRTMNQRFRLLTEDGISGGFAEVFKAYDLNSDPLETVAVKLLKVGVHPDEIANMTVAREFESLERLKHPNIVRLIDADIDVDSGRRFIALEWCDSSMYDYLDGGDAEPDDFISGIGVAICAAMAFAHENQVAHRDLKPENVLITADGVVKVADFGLSRVIDWLEVRPLQIAPTLADYATPPFAPPERDAGPIGRDVWGLGATLLSGVTRRKLESYEDLRSARDALDVLPDLRDILLDCLAEEPRRRPADCRVVHARVEAFWRERSAQLVDRVRVYIGVSTTAAESLGEPDHDLAARKVALDLRDSPSIVGTRGSKAGDRHWLLYGDSFAYRVAIDNSRVPLPRLSVIAAFVPPGFEADRARVDGLTLDHVEFTAGAPSDRARADADLAQLLDDVDRHELAAKARIRESEAARVLDQWRRQIDARTRIDLEQEKPIEFTAVQRQGRRAVFRTTNAAAGVVIGEVRRALAHSGARAFVRGVVDDLDDHSVTLYLEADVEGVPARGRLVVDTQASRVKIQRERAAVDILAHSPATGARPDLGDLIFNPQTNRTPHEVPIEGWFSSGLDESKQDAVRAALGAPDFYLVQGPPGTGKTTFIAELVAQELARNPQSRVLVSSQTNVALDNALDRIDRLIGQRRIVRLADRRFGKVAPEAERFRVEGQLTAWRDSVEIRSNAFLDAWVEGRGLSLGVVHESRFLRELAGIIEAVGSLEVELAEVNELREAADSLEDQQELDEQQQDGIDRVAQATDELAAFERTHASLMNKHRAAADRRDPQELTRLADDLLGGSAAASDLRNLVSLQADWIQRLGRGEGFVAALAHDSAVIGATCIGLAAVQELANAQFDLCIIDECSKATATETLVPMVRSRRWVLVGDEKQLPPMVEDALRKRAVISEFNLDEHELTSTLFGRLAEGLPSEAQALLSEQHRMVKAIGDLISECFYDGRLKSVGATKTRPISNVLPKPVTWHDTAGLSGHHEQPRAHDESSYVNTTEAGIVAGLVRKLNGAFARAAARSSVLVVAPYSAQITELRRRIDQLGDLDNIDIEIATVDAVQGREADYVVFSITRSNADNNAGFLSLDARANVALSRARSGLAIVGDMAFCRSTSTPFRAVASYVTSHADDCARIDLGR